MEFAMFKNEGNNSGRSQAPRLRIKPQHHTTTDTAILRRLPAISAIVNDFHLSLTIPRPGESQTRQVQSAAEQATVVRACRAAVFG